MVCRTSVASASQGLCRLEKNGVIKKMFQGVWALAGDKRMSPFLLIPFLSHGHRSYLSFTSALHSYGVIGQIPQVITVATTAHSRTVRTSAGNYHMHQLSPDLFSGFDWHSGNDYLIATPEKALVDCLYISTRKRKRFGHFPELDISALSRDKILAFTGLIRDLRVRNAVEKMVELLTPGKRRST